MAPETNDVRENDACPNDGVERHHQAKVGGSDNKSKTSRHPRWTRQETLILIEGKQVAENRGRKSYRSSSVFGSDQLESKWDAVSLFCREHGVSRGTMQCRKRWSNLIGDFKKIKTWESSQVKEEYESFWMMRNDLRREKKLPGFFDREIYDVLDGRAFTATAYPLTLVKITADAKYVNGMEAVVAEEVDDEEEEDGARAGFDRCRYVTAEDGVFSTIQQSVLEGNGRSSLEKQVNPKKTVPPSKKPNSGTGKGKQSDFDFWRGSMSQEAWKRRRMSLDGSRDTNMEEQLIKVLEKNSSMLHAQLEAQNMNCQRDREQRKDQNDGFIAALRKITDALGRIADKL